MDTTISDDSLVSENKDCPFRNTDYWVTHFDKDCILSVKYHDLSDKTKILVVTSIPSNENYYRPIILISGWFSIVDRWTEVLKVISKYSPVFYVETRDKISSELRKTKTTDMSVERMVQDLIEMQADTRFKFEESICIGSSMGGSILLKYLADGNIPPWKTILIGPIPKFEFPPFLTNIFIVLPVFFIKSVMKYVRWHIIHFKVDRKKEPEQAKKYDMALKSADPWKIRQSVRAAKKFNIWSEIEKIQSDVILVGASSDKLHVAEITKNIASKIKRSSYVDFKTNHATHSIEMGNYLAKLAKQ